MIKIYFEAEKSAWSVSRAEEVISGIWLIAIGLKRNGAMNTAAKCIVLDTWAGRRYYAVEVVGETPKKARIRVLAPGGVILPNRRHVQYGEIALVPKHAVYDMPAETHKIEQGYYDGHIRGYGGAVDAR